MKKIKIAHLYYDLMNLYGENGNVRYLVKKLEDSGVKAEVHFLTKDDEIDFSLYDFYYIGMGSDENKRIVLEDIIKYRDDINKAIEKNKFFLITGNAIELFGESITDLNNNVVNALQIFNFLTYEEDFRIVGEQYCDVPFELKDNRIIGFQNRSAVIKESSSDKLFKVLKGTGNKPGDQDEGIYYNNFYGTYMLGPILVRNPYFCDYIIKELCSSLDIDCDIKDEGMAYKAYYEYIKNFYENL